MLTRSLAVAAAAALVSAQGSTMVFPSWLQYTNGQTYTAGWNGFTYEVTPMTSAIQTNQAQIVQLGSFAGITLINSNLCQSGVAYGNLTYTGGTYADGCTNFGTTALPDRNRRATFRLECTTDGTTSMYPIIYEPTPCLYLGSLYVRCEDNRWSPGTLCVDLVSPTSSGTAAATPTVSASLGATSSSSPSFSGSTSLTASATGSTSFSATATASPTSSVTPTTSFNPQPAFLARFAGQSIQGLFGTNMYVVRPWVDANQCSTASPQVCTSIGRYAGMYKMADPTCPTGQKWAHMNFTGGVYAAGCSTTLAGQLRATSLEFRCNNALTEANVNNGPGSAMLLSQYESVACNYFIQMAINCANFPVPGTLCEVPPTPSGTASSSQTATNSPSASSTHAPDASDSVTPAGTASGTVAPTAPTPTSTITGTALSLLPLRARMTQITTSVAFNFMELLVMSPTGRILSTHLSTPPAYPSQSSTCCGGPPQQCSDMCLSPMGEGCGNCNSNNGLPISWYDVVFPNNVSSAVSFAYFFNRINAGCGNPTCEARAPTGNATLQLFSAVGQVGPTLALSNQAIQTLALSAPIGASTPNPADELQLNEYNRRFNPRFLRINAAALSCLHIREVMAIDSTYTNVALMKPTTGSDQLPGFSNAMAVNGNMSFDAREGDMTFAASCNGSAWWQVDLGGVYNLTRVIIFNRGYVINSATNTVLTSRLAGAVLQYLNYYGEVIASATLSAFAVQTVSIAMAGPTPTITAAATTTPSNAATPSITSSPSNTVSLGASVSSTATMTASGTAAPTASVSTTPSPTGLYYPAWMQYMRGQTYYTTSGLQSFKLSPFDSAFDAAMQCDINGCQNPGSYLAGLGGYFGWQALTTSLALAFNECPGGFGSKLTRMQHTGGNGGRLSTYALVCYTDNMTNITFINESPVNTFNFRLGVDCSRNPVTPGTLCVPASATPSPSPSVFSPSATASFTSTHTVYSFTITTTITPTYSASRPVTPSGTKGASATKTPLAPSPTGTRTAAATATVTISTSYTSTQVQTGTPTPSSTATPTPTMTQIVQPAWLGYLITTFPSGVSTDIQANGWAVSMMPFDRITQWQSTGTNHLGNYNNVTLVSDNTCASGLRLGTMTFTNGLYASGCSTTLPGQKRAANLRLSCNFYGNTILLPTVTELVPCMYLMDMSLNCGLNTAAPGTLCIAPSSTPTPTSSQAPTQSPTAAESATTTITATLSQGALPSDTPSASATPSATPSNTPSGSITPSGTPSSASTPSTTATSVTVPAWLGYTAGQSYVIQSGNSYNVMPYSLTQLSISGVVTNAPYVGWLMVNDATCAAGSRLGSQIFIGGVCAGGSYTMNVTYSCTSTGTTFVTAAALVGCTATINLAVECFRNPIAPNTLCINPTATPTSSVTATASVSAASTPSASFSYLASQSLTSSATPSSSTTASMTASSSATASATPTFQPLPVWMGYMRSRVQNFAVSTGGANFDAYRVSPYFFVTRTPSGGASVAFGTYAGWSPLISDATCASGVRYYEQRYFNGSSVGCPAGVSRSTLLRYTCTADAAVRMVVAATESPACNVVLNIGIDCTNNFGSMCLEPTPTPTQSQTGTGSSSPSQTATSSNTASSSGTQTQTGTSSPSQTATRSNTGSAGSTSSQTSTQTPSPSNTPSSSATASRTMTSTPTTSSTSSATTSPLSPNPFRVTVSTTNVALGVTELMAFSNTGKLMTSAAGGAINTMSSFPERAIFGGDLCANPYASCTLAETSNIGAQWYQSQFAGGTLGAVPISSVVFVNNAVFPTRVSSGGGRVTLTSPDGTTAQQSLTSAHYSTLTFAPSLAPVYPAAGDAFQASADSQWRHVRYVRITAVASSLLSIREVLVFDDTLTNVALQKPVTASPASGAYVASNANNGVMAQPTDQTSGDMYMSAAPGASWEVDLGAVYPVTQLMVFNRFATVSASVGNALSGAVVTFYNGQRTQLTGSLTLTNGAVQTLAVSYTQPTPSATPSSSQTGTGSSSATASSTATGSVTFGTSPTNTATVSISASNPPTASSTPTASATATATWAPRPWFLSYLYGNTYSLTAGSWSYSLRPFQNVVQGTTAVGNYVEWTTSADPTCPTGVALVSQRYTGGDFCAAINAPRTGTVNYVCGASTALTSVVESTTCNYVMTMTVDCANNGGTLCEPLPSNTPSNTPPMTGTPSNTGSASATRTGTASSTQTGTPSGTRTPASTGTRTGTAAVSQTKTGTGTASTTGTPSSSATSTGSPSTSATSTGTPSSSETNTGSPSASGTRTSSPSASETQSATPSSTATGSDSGSVSATATRSSSAAATSTRSPSAAESATPAVTGTPAGTPASSASQASTRTPAATASPAVSKSKTATKTKTRTRTKTKTPSKKKKALLV